MLRAMAAILASLALAGVLGAPGESEPAPDEAPGGYWTLSEQRERVREPLDGEEELTVGAILFSLGLLRAGAAGVTVWMAGQADLCPATDDAGCAAFRTYGFAGFGEAGLMVGTGLVYLAIGASRRSKHRRWERGETVTLGPWLMPARAGAGTRARLGGGGLRLQLRF